MTQAREVVPVMDPTTTPKRAKVAAPTKAGGAKTRKGLGGVYGASFTGEGTRGLTFERRWTRPGVHPYDEITWEYRTAGISSETGKTRVRAEGRRGPELLEPARHQRRGQQVLPRPRRHAGARAQRQAAHRPRRQQHRRVGRDPALLRERRGPGRVQGRAHPPARPPEDGVQLAGLVQRRDRREAAVLRVLHQLGPGQHGLDHGPRQDRGHAVQVRLGRRRQPVDHPLVQGQDDRRRHRQRPRLLHARLRRLRRRDQVGRQDPPRRQDGDPGRRPSRRRRVHRQQGERGEEGLGPDRAGLRPELHGRGLRQRLLPEREPQRARDRRVHEGRRARRGLADPRGHRRPAGRHVQGPRHLPQDGRRGPPVRRPRDPVRHHDQRLAHEREQRADLRVEPVLGVHVPQRHGVQPRLA